MNIDLADTKYQKPVSKTPKNSRDFLKTFLILASIGILVWFGILFYQKTTLEKENVRYQTSIETTTERVKKLLNSDNPAKKIAVAKTLNKLEKRRILWSEVMAKIIKLEIPGITFRDFSVGDKGQISATVSARSFNSVQQFVKKLNSDENVSQVVINSIRLDEATAGLLVDLNFNFKY